MNAYATIRKALEAAIEYPNSTHAELKAHDALSALAELEKAASEPVAYQYAHPYFGGAKIWREEQRWNGHTSDESRALYAAPPIPAPQPQAAVTDEMCELVSQLNDRLIESVHECYLLREALASTNAGLEPTPDQCVRIGKYAARVSDSTGNGASWQGNGRAIVAMVRDVMGGGE